MDLGEDLELAEWKELRIVENKLGMQQVVGYSQKHHSGMVENKVVTSRWNTKRMVGEQWLTG
jgi:hypothetical protein